jgi:murein DD-endopeptidase MepM/ murein hydrolase activator NlpD
MSWLVFAASIGFLAGMLVMAAVVTIFPAGAAVVTNTPLAAASAPGATAEVEVRPSLKESPPAVEPPPAPPSTDDVPVLGADPLADLRQRNLTLPVHGISKDDLRSNFDELRGGGARRHEAIDILAPRNTPVFAVEDGTIARLFLSDAGGITIYQFDPTETYVYYYAHLEKYASGLDEGDRVSRGDVIGYVGTTGNAPRNTPHLHFAIFKMTGEKKWWQGTAIDPYSVLR